MINRREFCEDTHFAIDRERISQSFHAFNEMNSGIFREDPNYDWENPPDLSQLHKYAQFLTGIKHFAKYGTPNKRYCDVNFLRNGIWEFKYELIRVSFSDTDGKGNNIPKNKIRDRNNSKHSDSDEFWHIPDFDDYFRLLYVFGKTGQKTEEEDIQESFRIREEDLEHDRVA